MLGGPLVFERFVALPLLVTPYDMTLSPFLIQLLPAFLPICFGSYTLFLTFIFIFEMASWIFLDIGLLAFIANLDKFWAATYSSNASFHWDMNSSSTAVL